MPRSLIQAHRFLAFGVGIFIATHLTVHVTALSGIAVHKAMLGAVQTVYRNPIVEPLLLIAILAQIMIGARLLARRWKSADKGFWGWAQILSGLYLAFFMLVHAGAALSTRHLLGMDTDFYWSAATFLIAPFSYAFIPYYFLAVMSVFTHLAAAVHFGWPQQRVLPRALLAAGAIVYAMIFASFSGALFEINLPPENEAYFEKLGF